MEDGLLTSNEILGALSTLTFLLLVALAAGVVVLAKRTGTMGTMDPTHRGVVLLLGKPSRRIITPGWYFRLPYLYKIVPVDVRRMSIDLRIQELLFKAGVQIGLNFTLVYRVEDPIAAFSIAKELGKIMSELALAASSETYQGSDYTKLLAANDEELGNRLCDRLQEYADDYGVRVEEFVLTEFRMPEDLRRALSQEAIAESNRRSDLIKAKAVKDRIAAMKQGAEDLAALAPDVQRIILEMLRLETYEDMGGGAPTVIAGGGLPEQFQE